MPWIAEESARDEMLEQPCRSFSCLLTNVNGKQLWRSAVTVDLLWKTIVPLTRRREGQL